MEEASEEEEGFVAFEGRKVKAILYKLAPMDDDMKKEITAYVHDGYMDKDARFARTVFGEMNSSGRRDYSEFFESPWVEEHVRETGKRKRLNMIQKNVATRTFIKAMVGQDGNDVEKYMHTADKLREWEEQRDDDEDVKTVSRMVQSFERIAVREVLLALEERWASGYGNAKTHMERLRRANKSEEDTISMLCHSLRRCDNIYDVFAHMVCMEMVWADATNGSKNTSIHMTKQIEEKRNASKRQLVRSLDEITDPKKLPADKMGIPLMHIKKNMCISSNGVLVVGKESTDVVYVLDMITGFDTKGRLDLTDVKSIQITQVFSERDEEALKAAKEKEQSKRRTRSQGGLSSLG